MWHPSLSLSLSLITPHSCGLCERDWQTYELIECLHVAWNIYRNKTNAQTAVFLFFLFFFFTLYLPWGESLLCQISNCLLSSPDCLLSKDMQTQQRCQSVVSLGEEIHGRNWQNDRMSCFLFPDRDAYVLCMYMCCCFFFPPKKKSKSKVGLLYK